MTMSRGMDRRTESLIGIVFLVGMIITMLLAVVTFEGTPTIILVLTSLIFLAVALFFLSGGTTASGSGAGGGGGGGSSQQQSVTISDGNKVHTVQQGGEVLTICPDCEARVPETSKFCPDCGATVGA